jgi:phosphoribosylamine-glycine ligase
VNILLVSQHSIGAWWMLRLLKEGHSCEWWLTKRGGWDKALEGLVPAPYLRRPPESVLRECDLILFDQNGMGKLAEELKQYAPVLGDSLFASKMEDDRLFGIETMEAAGIEVPFYETFQFPDDARAFLKIRPGRYVYKPSTPPGQEQDCAVTYVASGVEDLLASLDKLYEKSMNAPFLLQEVVEGEEISVEGWFDGSNFHFLGLTLEEKKFMNGGMGPNTGAAGTLEGLFSNVPKLHTRGLGKLTQFLRTNNYRGMIDLNTIVNESHAYGLEFTTRWGYDCCPTRFALLEKNLGEWLFQIATAPEGGLSGEFESPTRVNWAASTRYSIPPYPTEIEGYHPNEVPISGIEIDDAWRDTFLYDAKLNQEGKLETAGVTGHVCSVIGVGHTAKGAWEAQKRKSEKLKIPNMQARTDCCESTLKRLEKVIGWGWLTG